MHKPVNKKMAKTRGGFTLVEVLVVMAVAASLSLVVVAKISDTIHRNEATTAVARRDAAATAEAQYTIAQGGVPDDHPFSFAECQPYLAISGNPVQSEADFMKYTGNRTMNWGTPATGPSVSPEIDPKYLPNSGATTTTQ